MKENTACLANDGYDAIKRENGFGKRGRGKWQLRSPWEAGIIHSAGKILSARPRSRHLGGSRAQKKPGLSTHSDGRKGWADVRRDASNLMGLGMKGQVFWLSLLFSRTVTESEVEKMVFGDLRRCEAGRGEEWSYELMWQDCWAALDVGGPTFIVRLANITWCFSPALFS